jgi:hypothetical protein
VSTHAKGVVGPPATERESVAARSTVTTAPPAGGVRRTGRLDDVAALQEFVAGADVVVNTSRIEGFPLVVLEAEAVGRPLVLSALPYVTGLPDLRLFPPGVAGGARDPAGDSHRRGQAPQRAMPLGGAPLLVRELGDEAECTDQGRCRRS